MQPEDQYPRGEGTECKGSYSTFEAAVAVARKSLSRNQPDYEYYKEGRTDDNESLYSDHDSDAETQLDPEEEEDREEEDICIRTFHDYDKSEVVVDCASGTVK